MPTIYSSSSRALCQAAVPLTYRVSGEVAEAARRSGRGEAEGAVGEPQPAALVPPPLEQNCISKTDISAVTAGGVIIVIVVGLFATEILPGLRPNPTSPPPQLPPNNQRTQNNGLTKETNDFLRQLSKQLAGR